MLELDIDTDPVYVHTDIGDISWNGHVWKGVGALGAIEGVKEDASMQPNSIDAGLRIGADGIADLVAQSRNLHHEGRLGALYFAARDLVTGELVGNGPVKFSEGSMQQIQFKAGLYDGTASVEIVDERYVFDRTIAENISNEHQQRRHPGDLGQSFMPDVVNFRETWGPDGPRANPYTPGRNRPGYTNPRLRHFR